MSSLDDLLAELEVAKAQHRGTDAGRLKKQLAALGHDPDAKPARATARAEVAETRADAARASGDEPTERRTAPRGRQSPTEHKSKSS